MSAAGDVADFGDEVVAAMEAEMADALEVEPEAVTCDVTAGSVNLVFSVLVADQTEADSVSADAEAEFSTASAASALLNVTVLSAPVVAVDDGGSVLALGPVSQSETRRRQAARRYSTAAHSR